MKRQNLHDILNGVAYEVIQHGDRDEIASIVINTRKAAADCLYVCIRGLRVDGHKFIEDVAKAGAAAVMIDEDQESYPPGLTVVKVANSRVALSTAAARFFGSPAEHFRLIGVTGTNGKTSTVYFLETILEKAGHKTGVIGTVGTQIGGEPVDIPYDTATTPDTLELQHIFAHMHGKGADNVVMEVSSHALSLYKVEGIFFDVGIFTNLTQDHLDFHGTMENYRDAKSKLFGQCRIGVMNADDESSEIIMKNHSCQWLTYGIHNECDLKAVHIEYLPEGSSFDVEIDGVTEHFYLPVKGRFNIYNSLAAIGAALAVNIPIDTIRKGIAAIKGIPGRIQAIPNNRNVHVLVDYAHSPDGLVNVINAVREFTKGNVITVFGCGGDKDKAKRPIMGRIAGELSDYCFITSDNPRSEPPEEIIRQVEEGLIESNCPYEKHVSRRDAIFAGVARLAAGDTLIIAGKGHENYQIIGNETLPFDDVEVAKEALGASCG